MERKKSILLTVGIIATVVIVLAAVYILILTGIHREGWCRATVSLRDPIALGENVWMVEIENVDMTEGCSPDLEQFGVFLDQGESIIIARHQLQNGLIAQSEETLIFFADQGKVGSVDTGDQFYLVNLEVGSEYEFHVLDGWGSAGNVTVYT